MGEIRWTEEASRWLHDIHNYIAADSQDAAIKVTLGIYEKVQILRQFPKMGHKYRVETDGEVRILLYGHYRIAHLLKSSAEIDILGVFHGALDIDRYFL